MDGTLASGGGGGALLGDVMWAIGCTILVGGVDVIACPNGA